MATATKKGRATETNGPRARPMVSWGTARIEANCEVAAVDRDCTLAGVDLTAGIRREFRPDGGFEERLEITIPGAKIEHGRDGEVDIWVDRWDDGSLAALIDLLMALRIANGARGER